VSMALDRFVDEVSSDSPAPGGGSVAALAGSLAAALSAMVANLTVGKQQYAAVWKEMSALAERAQQVKAALVRAVDEDADAFNDVMAAVRLPKTTPEEQAARADAIEDGYRQAARVPLGTARLCLEAIKLAGEVARKGNVHSASDAGVAALIGRAGVEGAALNVLINLGSVKDEAFKKDCRDTVESVVAEASRRCGEIVAHVKGTFEG